MAELFELYFLHTFHTFGDISVLELTNPQLQRQVNLRCLFRPSSLIIS